MRAQSTAVVDRDQFVGRAAQALLAVFTTCVFMAACVSGQSKDPNASFVGKVSGSGAVHLTGWVRLAGEFILYSDIESMNQRLRFPHCISGVFNDQYDRKNLAEYNGHFVTVTGTLFKYSDLPDEDRPAIPRKMLGDSVVPNWCFGPNVLLIKSMKKN
jgi:hypothetical protein